jgi:hypothetical protein
MLSVDAAQFYDLPGAGRLLWADSARLARQAAARAVPATRIAGAWRLPRAWVEAEAGIQPADAEALKAFWLERLAPPSFAARRSLRSRARLPAERLLTADEAGRALFCDRARLARLDADGTLPALVLDGAPHFDADLVAALAADDPEAPAAVNRAAARRALVLEWARAEYTAETPKATTLPPELSPQPPPAPPSRGLARADGFETLDED